METIKKLTEKQIKEARDWVKDCLDSWEDLDTKEDVDKLTDEEIEDGIEAFYWGGLKGFKDDFREI